MLPGTCRDLTRGLPGSLSGVHRQVVGSSSTGCRELVGSSSGVHRKNVGKFIGSSPTGCRELAENSPEEYWKFIGSSLKEIRSLLGVHRKDTMSLSKRRLDNENYTLSVIVSIIKELILLTDH
ncbi:hypothetical protein GW17_00035889 [Ensete ventricosum]|nr:hypothetical protein GW17_00035889 [Ensete ventricosum]RZS25757.1 hypothetical protein BHM03_00059007 [Ensete ventricosum]